MNVLPEFAIKVKVLENHLELLLIKVLQKKREVTPIIKKQKQDIMERIVSKDFKKP